VDGRGFGPAIVDFSQNICITDEDKSFLGFNVNSGPYADELKAQLGGSGNVLHYTSSNPVYALPPTKNSGSQPIYVNTVTSDPSVIFNMDNLDVIVSDNSAVINSVDRLVSHDLYGRSRSLLTEPGAVIYSNRPLPPTGLTIQ